MVEYRTTTQHPPVRESLEGVFSETCSLYSRCQHGHLTDNNQAPTNNMLSFICYLSRYPTPKVLANNGAEVLSLRKRTNERRNHPTFSTLIGWSGWASALGGVLFAVWGYLDGKEHYWYLDIPVSLLGVVVPLLFFVGLAGVYAKCRGQMGWLGKTGFAFSLVGAELSIYDGVVNARTWYVSITTRADYWEEGYIFSEETAEAATQAAVAEKSWLLVMLQDHVLILLAGLTIATLATVRTRGLRDWGLLLLTIVLFGWGHRFTDAGTMVAVRVVHVGFGVLFSLSWVVLGYALWSSRNTVRRTTPRSLKAL